MSIPRTGQGPDYEVNRDFLLRYYECDAMTPRLITAKQMRELIGNKEVAENAIQRILSTPNDRVLLKFRRGVRVIAVAR